MQPLHFRMSENKEAKKVVLSSKINTAIHIVTKKTFLQTFFKTLKNVFKVM